MRVLPRSPRAFLRPALLLVLVVLVMVGKTTRNAPRLQELRERHHGLEVPRPQGFTELLQVLPKGLRVARPPSRTRLRWLGIAARSSHYIWRRLAFDKDLDGLDPHWTRCGSDRMGGQPAFHEGPEPLASKSKPAFPLRAERHEHVLEPPKCPLAVDGLPKLRTELRVLYQRDKPLHPSVLLA